ncbi:SURF1 family protein [Aquabacterium sp.]|uniref:SURF1 family protein n=1 Tax=Aquabacterium sp. TaxID=1872578 RepID=UPI002C2A88BB|nr:SURF1 family protein [Aquabacterium sp.]HSW03380.1 SURF1 family protein [Aquabacterium sp.]
MTPRATRWLIGLAAVTSVLLTTRLGLWQLGRAAQKIALQTAIEQRASLPPLAPLELARDKATAAAQHYRRIPLTGRWLAQHTIYLDNRQMDGRPGFYVVTPLLLAPGDAVLVQRGWVPRDAQDRARLVAVDTPAGELALTGRVAPPPSALLSLGPEGQGIIRQNLDLDALARDIGVALRPLSVQQLDDGPSTPTQVLRRGWPLPAVDVGKHHGYAFQWFALSALIAGLYVWFQLIRPRRLAPR